MSRGVARCVDYRHRSGDGEHVSVPEGVGNFQGNVARAAQPYCFREPSAPTDGAEQRYYPGYGHLLAVEPFNVPDFLLVAINRSVVGLEKCLKASDVVHMSMSDQDRFAVLGGQT